MRVTLYTPEHARAQSEHHLPEDVRNALANGKYWWLDTGGHSELLVPNTRDGHGNTWWVASVEPEPDEAAKEAIVDIVRMQWSAS